MSTGKKKSSYIKVVILAIVSTLSFNKGRSSKFRGGSLVRQTPEEGRRTYQPKRCGNNNKNEDNSPKNLNDKNHLVYIQGNFNKFPDIFVQAFKIVVDSWIFSMLLLYIVWDGWPIFYDFRFQWTATAAIEMYPPKAWLSKLVNFKMQSGREEERYAIKLCFKFGKKMPEKHMEWFRLLFDHHA